MEVNGYYLPEYKLTPQSIFKNEIIAFDVNFFNPKADKIEQKVKQVNSISSNDYKIGYTATVYDSNGNQVGNERQESGLAYLDHSNPGMEAGVKEATGTYTFDNLTPEDAAKSVLGIIGKEGQKYDSVIQEKSYENGQEKTEYTVNDGYSTGDGKYTTVQNYTYKYGQYSVKVNYYVTYFNGWTSKTSRSSAVNETIIKERSPARELQPIVASWYLAFRNIALVALLSVLVYIGIRIVLSTVASDKAKYQQMLVDWIVALCLVFLMHYIMSFAVTINEKIIDAISSITISTYGGESDVYGDGAKEIKTMSKASATDDTDGKAGIRDAGVELFKIEGKDAEDAWKTLVGKEDSEYAGKESVYRDRFENEKTLYWPANDFMTQARLKGQEVEVETEIDANGNEVAKGDGTTEINEKQTATVRAGYNIIYIVLVIYTIIFCFTYLKRVVYMAFLTIIAPLVAITYPIDKINDGKAQAFDLWLKEYIFNLLIQPMHLILYTILIGSAMRFAANNIFYVVIALGFLMPAEKLLRRFFGFEKAQTPGVFGGVAGSALMFSGLQRLMHPKPPKGGLGPGKNSNKGESANEGEVPPWKDRQYDPTEHLIGTGTAHRTNPNSNDDTENDTQERPNIPEFRDNLTEDQQQRLELAQGGRREALEAMNDANTEEDRQDYQNLLDSYEQDINGLRNPDYVQAMNNNGGRGNTTSTVNNTNDIGNQRIRMAGSGSTNNSNNIRTNNQSTSYREPRKRSIRRAIRRGTRSYFTGPNGIGQKIQDRHVANGGFLRRGARIAAGLAAGGTLAAAGGIIGITSGDPSKAAQYMSAGMAGGYTLGKGAANSISDTLKVEGTLSDAKRGYYGDEYSKHQQKKYKKDFVRNEDNLRKLEDKLKIERKEAKKIMEENVPYYLDKEIYNIDDIAATYRLEQELGRDAAVATAQYATQVMNNEDTRTMTAKRKKEYRDTFIPKFTQYNSSNPEADVDTLFSNIDKFHKFRK